MDWTSGLEGSVFGGLPNVNIGISRYNGTAYDASIGNGDNSTNTVTATFSDFSPFIVTRKFSVAPVQLASITAYAGVNGNEIRWNAANEVAIDRYIVERSTDGISFNAIGSVRASNARSYQFTDLANADKVIYYRIKVIGLGGYVKISTIVLVKKSQRSDITIYPNPAAQWINISGLKGEGQVSLINASGQILRLQKTAATVLSWDVTALAPGICRIAVMQDGVQQAGKTFVKE